MPRQASPTTYRLLPETLAQIEQLAAALSLEKGVAVSKTDALRIAVAKLHAQKCAPPRNGKQKQV